MGYRDDVLGDDVLGDTFYGGAPGMHVVGAEEAAAAVRTLARAAQQGGAAGAIAARVRRPDWRERLAPGAAMPGTKLYPLALTPQAGGGILLPALTAITFLARPQKPFRGERLVAIVSRSAGATAVIPTGELFVGTDLVQATAGGIPLETFGPNAFGVRMAWPQAEPGVEVRINVGIIGTIPAGESIAVSLVVLGETQA